MTKTSDSTGRVLTLPEDLRVCECHACGRLAVSRKIGPNHAQVVRPLIKRGWMTRVTVQAPRPTCDPCRRLMRALGGDA